jgi:hypothetical protein
VLVEPRFAAWLTAGLNLYRAHPRMLEAVFFDQSQIGEPTGIIEGALIDVEKRWLPDEFAGGTLRWGAETFPIVGNTADTLRVTGDPSLALDRQLPYYQVVPPAVAGLTQLLQEETFTVSTAFAQVPTQMPAVTIRLEKDEQADTYLGDTLEQYVENGVEFDVRSHAMQGAYLFSLWATNREAVLWLYAWLHTYALNSISQFNSWGLYDISLSGSDLDPALQYLAERAYTRHLLLTAARVERAVSTREPVWVNDVWVKVFAHYQTFHMTIAPRMD